MSDALRALVRDHSLTLYRYALWMCGDAVTARELVREALLSAALTGRPLTAASPPRALLIDKLRREHARRYGVRALDLSRISVRTFERDGGGDPLTRRAIAGLPADHREPLVLSDICDFTDEEIAQALGITPEAVPGLLARARALVTRAMSAPRRAYPRSRPRLRRMAGALGVAALLAVVGTPAALWPDLGELLVEHAVSERALQSPTPLPREVVEGALYGVGARLRAPLGAVLRAERCRVAGGTVHLVVKGPEGIADVMVIPHTHIERRVETRQGDQLAIFIPMGTGAVAVIGGEGARAVEAIVRTNLWFVTD